MGGNISSIRNVVGQSIFIPAPTLTEKTLLDQDGKVRTKAVTTSHVKAQERSNSTVFRTSTAICN